MAPPQLASEPSNFSAEKEWNRKEVKTMTYTKPEITRLGEAAELICSGESMLKLGNGADVRNPNHQTIPAYSTEE